MQFEREAEPVEVSVVIPCLNEEDTLGSCIKKARQALQEQNIAAKSLWLTMAVLTRLELSLWKRERAW